MADSRRSDTSQVKSGTKLCPLKIRISKPPSAYLEFDGSSKGNPGRGGAGAVLKSKDGNLLASLQEGLGDNVTNNEAEYRALNSGMRYALEQGYDRLHVRGDSELVIKQVTGEWKTKSPNLVDLNREAKSLKRRFSQCDMEHVTRDRNSEADRLANKATNLDRGESQRENSGGKLQKNKNSGGKKFG